MILFWNKEDENLLGSTVCHLNYKVHHLLLDIMASNSLENVTSHFEKIKRIKICRTLLPINFSS